MEIALQAGGGAGRRFLSSILPEKNCTRLSRGSKYDVETIVCVICRLSIRVRVRTSTKAEAHLISVPSSESNMRDVQFVG